MKVYISGPITGLPNENREAFEEAEKALRKAGHIPANPHVFCQDIPRDAPHSVFMRRCMKILEVCDVITPLQGYTQSDGCRQEMRRAAELGMKLYDVDALCAN